MLGSCSHSLPMHKLCTAARVEEGKRDNLCYDLIHILSKIANLVLRRGTGLNLGQISVIQNMT